MPEVSRKVAVITGAGNGLGRAPAMEFFGRGFHLALIDIEAASMIANAIVKGRYRIVVGTKTKLADLASRLFPSAIHELIGRNKKRFPFV